MKSGGEDRGNEFNFSEKHNSVKKHKIFMPYLGIEKKHDVLFQNF